MRPHGRAALGHVPDDEARSGAARPGLLQRGSVPGNRLAGRGAGASGVSRVDAEAAKAGEGEVMDDVNRTYDCWTICVKLRRAKDKRWIMAFKQLNDGIMPFFATKKAAQKWLYDNGRKTNMAIAWRPMKVRLSCGEIEQ